MSTRRSIAVSLTAALISAVPIVAPPTVSAQRIGRFKLQDASGGRETAGAVCVYENGSLSTIWVRAPLVEARDNLPTNPATGKTFRKQFADWTAVVERQSKGGWKPIATARPTGAQRFYVRRSGFTQGNPGSRALIGFRSGVYRARVQITWYSPRTGLPEGRVSPLVRHHFNVATGTDAATCSNPLPPKPPSTDFREWKPEGSELGNWRVTDEGRSVTQLTESQGFLVGPDDLSNYRLTGTIQANGRENDYLGLVFGYGSPISTSGSNECAGRACYSSFILFDWKQSTQKYCPPDSTLCYTAQPGFTLTRVNASYRMDVWADIGPYFWEHRDEPLNGFDVLARNNGADKGFKTGVAHAVLATYSPTRIQLAVDGAVVFDVAGDFPAGRVGLYTFSQSNATFQDFEITNEG